MEKSTVGSMLEIDRGELSRAVVHARINAQINAMIVRDDRIGMLEEGYRSSNVRTHIVICTLVEIRIIQ
jgi:zona occludens toxin (predicted ATPase)